MRDQTEVVAEDRAEIPCVHDKVLQVSFKRAWHEVWAEYVYPAKDHPWMGPLIGLTLCALLLYLLARMQMDKSESEPGDYYMLLWVLGTMLFLIYVLLSRTVDVLI